MSAPIHLHCGEHSAGTLRASGVPGQVLLWMDLLMEGPVPVEDEGESWLAARAGSLVASTGGGLTLDVCRKHLLKQDADLRAVPADTEVVLWFDACLYDQLILIRVLDALRRWGRTEGVSLICIGEHAEIPRFKGLGELDARQMASLFPRRQVVTAQAFADAADAWRAVRAATPGALQVMAKRHLALPFVPQALLRLLSEYPSTRNGLGQLEQSVLAAAMAGASDPLAVFKAASDSEPRPYFGDTLVWATVNRLAAGPSPLLALLGPGPLPQWDAPRDLSAWRIELTDAGVQVGTGAADALPLRGVDRWIGGVHLVWPGSIWRWNAARQAIEAGGVSV